MAKWTCNDVLQLVKFLTMLICLSQVGETLASVQSLRNYGQDNHDLGHHLRETQPSESIVRIERQPSLEPTVLVLGENVDNARKGDTVTLHCNVIVPRGVILQYVRWTLGPAILTENNRYVNANLHRYNIIKTVDAPGRPIYTLIITNIQMRDSGEYRCIIGYDYFGSDYPIQMWANINVRMFIDYVPDPICESSGGVGHQTWLSGQHMYIDCRIENVNPELELEWVWNKHTTPVITRHFSMTPFVENGNTSVSFHLIANWDHDLDSFVCIVSSLSVPGLTRNCTIGPIRVLDQIPTSGQVTYHAYAVSPDVTSQGTSMRKEVDVDTKTMTTVSVTVSPSQSQVAVVFIAVIIGLMLLILILAGLCIVCVHRKRRGNVRRHVNRRLPAAHTYYTCARSSDDEYSSSTLNTIEYKQCVPKPTSGQRLIKIDEHKYEIINVPGMSASGSAKKRVVVPYAITDISMGEVTHREYATVRRESPDGASLISFEGFVDNILYEPTTIGDFATEQNSEQTADEINEV